MLSVGMVTVCRGPCVGLGLLYGRRIHGRLGRRRGVSGRPDAADDHEGEDGDPSGVGPRCVPATLQGSISMEVGAEVIPLTGVPDEVGPLGQVHVKVVVMGRVELGREDDVEHLARVHLPGQFVE